VILLSDIDELGFSGQEVAVKSGYARNFLVPNRFAVYASDKTRSAFKTELSVSWWPPRGTFGAQTRDVQPEEEEAATRRRERNLLRKRLQSLHIRFAVATVDDTEMYGAVT
jgi:large subunit ribosomal protein L9